MATSKPTRARAFGLRVVSPDGTGWHWFASLPAMARDLALRLYDATHRVRHGTHIGPRVPFTRVDADGIVLTWIRETPYQAEHTRFGATWRIRTDWQTYEVFDSNGHTLPIARILDSFDLEEYLNRRKRGRIAHGDRGHGPIPWTRKLRGGSGWFRGIQTSQEIRLNALVLVDEGEIPVRAARNQKNLPTKWEDFPYILQRSWKAQRKGRKQWDRRR